MRLMLLDFMIKVVWCYGRRENKVSIMPAGDKVKKLRLIGRCHSTIVTKITRNLPSGEGMAKVSDNKNKYFYTAYCVPGTVLRIVPVVAHLNLSEMLCSGRFDYIPILPLQRLGTNQLGNFSKVTQLRGTGEVGPRLLGSF